MKKIAATAAVPVVAVAENLLATIPDIPAGPMDIIPAGSETRESHKVVPSVGPQLAGKSNMSPILKGIEAGATAGTGGRQLPAETEAGTVDPGPP